MVIGFGCINRSVWRKSHADRRTRFDVAKGVRNNDAAVPPAGKDAQVRRAWNPEAGTDAIDIGHYAAGEHGLDAVVAIVGDHQGAVAGFGHAVRLVELSGRT